MPEIYGTFSADTINGASEPDQIYGLDGNDTIYAGDGGDVLNDDWVSAGPGDDVVYGGAGGDMIYDETGNDVVYAGDDRDLLYGSAGNDYYDGGTGYDSISYHPALAGVLVDLTLPSGQARSLQAYDAAFVGIDTLYNIEYVAGSRFDDRMVGNAGDNRFWGDEGNDTLLGGEGRDELLGGNGDDLLDGGDGVDQAMFAGPVVGVTVSLAITGPQNTGHGMDTLTRIENLIGTYQDDVLTGNEQVNLLVGDPGNDILSGGGGADVLEGGPGSDTLTGGAGADTFRDTWAGLNGDTITDLSRGDRIVLTDATLGPAVSLTTGSSGSQLTYGSTSLFLSNVRNPSIAFSAAPEGGVQIVFGGPPIIFSSAVVSDPSWGAFPSQMADLPKIPGEYADHRLLYDARQFSEPLPFRMADDFFVAS